MDYELPYHLTDHAKSTIEYILQENFERYTTRYRVYIIDQKIKLNYISDDRAQKICGK